MRAFCHKHPVPAKRTGPVQLTEKPMTSAWHEIDWDTFWYWKPAADRPVSRKICWVLDSLSSPLPGK
jgi:hypothetical protein